jgi:hypothetical protein
MPLSDRDFWKMFSPMLSAQRAAKVQCLGEMPEIPGDCYQARLSLYLAM